ncbi:NPAS1_3 [Lepeophtheirus salmonis]|uniref:NPAS1_3 n=1 Tax=Lepeophtheirus salmonis TaxID=72036 RepID=A0A7R8H3K6_LEPSM|nr:NPAS1_3 [Lepeophtheirus salmonis]CAF2845626.1 NPAS1_3 [Lepeophtheirus salmonis]
MQGSTGEAAHYGHSTPVPMDLHMPQPFSYYSCIMDNNAMFAAQQAQYNKMYCGLDNATGRPHHQFPTIFILSFLQEKKNVEITDELTSQGTINTRILELRKEKSRDAARSRRGKENFEFYELAKMLPLPGAITSQLDKASIIRLTIAYLRLREFAASGNPTWVKDPQIKKVEHSTSMRNRANVSGIALDIFEEHEGTHILQSLDGFAISLNSDGRFLYISETVSIYLGLSQVELTGKFLLQEGGSDDSSSGTSPGIGAPPAIPDVCYPVTSLMHSRPERMSGKPSYDRAFCVRMKSTLTKRGCHFKSSGYRVVLLLGKLRAQYSYSQKKNLPPIMGFIGLAIALPPPSVHEVRLESDMFVTKLTFDFKIAHCEPKVSDLLDYTGEELTGQSMYSIIHAEDVHRIKSMHEDLLNKGQVMSNYYRLMNKMAGYTWMQSCATLVCNTKNAEEQSIICVNYVLSGPQESNIIMDEKQMSRGPGIRIKEDCDPCDYGPANSPRDKVFDTSLSGDHKLRDKCEMNGTVRGGGGHVVRHPTTGNEMPQDPHNMYIGPEHDPGQVRLGQQPAHASFDNKKNNSTFLATTNTDLISSDNAVKRCWRKRASDSNKDHVIINEEGSDVELKDERSEEADGAPSSLRTLHSDFNDFLLYKQRKGPSFPSPWIPGSGGGSPILKSLYGGNSNASNLGAGLPGGVGAGSEVKSDSFSSIVASYQQAGVYNSSNGPPPPNPQQPAQPLAIKPPQLYGLDQYHGYTDQLLYPHPGTTGFHLYHPSPRGAPTWYSPSGLPGELIPLHPQLETFITYDHSWHTDTQFLCFSSLYLHSDTQYP